VNRRTAVAALLLALPLDAQDRSRPRIEVALPPQEALSTEGPAIRVVNVISDRAMQDLIRNGFPALLHYRVELWALGGLVNDLRRRVEWVVSVRYDALGQKYRIARISGDRVDPVGQFAQFADAVAEVERPFKAPIVANREANRQYYSVSLDVETMSANDLDEVQRWLRGEMQPAVHGSGNPGTALGSGVRKFFVKLLGGERRNLQARSGTFRVRPDRSAGPRP
jgi:hypothetical protein